MGGGDHEAEPERPEVTVIVDIEEQCSNHADQRCQHHCHRHLPPRHIAGGGGEKEREGDGRRGREGNGRRGEGGGKERGGREGGKRSKR